MSIYAEYAHGLLTDREFRQAAAREEAEPQRSKMSFLAEAVAEKCRDLCQDCDMSDWDCGECPVEKAASAAEEMV